MTYYKIVDDKLQSVIVAHSKHVKYAVQYKLDEWVTPIISGSKLMVFNDLKIAQVFLFDFDGLVFECEVKNPVLSTSKSLLIPIYYDVDLAEMWRLNKYFCGTVPSGTVFCDEVKLIRQIGE